MSDNNKPEKTTISAPNTKAEHKETSAEKQANKPYSIIQIARWFISALIIISIGGGYYLWGVVYDAKDELDQNVASTRTQVSSLSRALINSESDLKSQIRQLNTLQDELSKSVQALLSKSTHMRKDWLISEAEYLVKLAVNRLTLEEDIKTAITALSNADARLLEAGDPGLLLLRQEIRNNITALKALPIIDISGMSIQISSVINQVDRLPLITTDPESIKQTHQAAAQKITEDAPINWQQVTSKVIEDVFSLVRITKHDQVVQPLLTHEQRFYLTQNLKLQLEQARTALLHQQQAVFRERITKSISWIQEFFDKTKTATQSTITILSKLNTEKLTQETPDLIYTLKMFDDFQADIRLKKKPVSIKKQAIKPKIIKKIPTSDKKTTITKVKPSAPKIAPAKQQDKPSVIKTSPPKPKLQTKIPVQQSPTIQITKPVQKETSDKNSIDENKKPQMPVLPPQTKPESESKTESNTGISL